MKRLIPTLFLALGLLTAGGCKKEGGSASSSSSA